MPVPDECLNGNKFKCIWIVVGDCKKKVPDDCKNCAEATCENCDNASPSCFTK